MTTDETRERMTRAWKSLSNGGGGVGTLSVLMVRLFFPPGSGEIPPNKSARVSFGEGLVWGCVAIAPRLCAVHNEARPFGQRLVKWCGTDVS